MGEIRGYNEEKQKGEDAQSGCGGRRMCKMGGIYDDEKFFEQYAGMDRSRLGLAGAGEWHQFRRMIPKLTGKSVLDLGCGYGWHCRYAREQGARQVLGLDLSERMIRRARKEKGGDGITYRVCGLEDYEYPEETFHCVISNLALHYVRDLETVFEKIYRTLKKDGVFLMNIEHPVFTAGVRQDWIYGRDGTPLYWPVDRYFEPGERMTCFLGMEVKKEHHTLTQILGGLLDKGFELKAIEEAVPPEEMMDQPGMKDELRRPMMLLVRADKPDRR